MLLAVDIGNTTISLGVFHGQRIIKRMSVSTDAHKSAGFYASFLKTKCKNIDKVIICSVVPKMTEIFARAGKKAFALKPYIIGKDIIVPIKNLYRNPKQVGQDRLVNAYAGFKLYGAPLIIVDFGTAITFDTVSQKGEYLGGIIAAGLNTSLKALSEHTALLPKIKLDKPKELIGRDTRESMLSGVVYGSSCLADDLILRLKVKLGKSARAIATGGDSALIKPYCCRIDIWDKDLTLRGISLLNP
ncbi:MAG: type III pantothenate kinase [Candidatus Omnitrophica bacterium]|nr:type III pantothenate kinase [Candidatus Omnitrophota bacterium]